MARTAVRHIRLVLSPALHCAARRSSPTAVSLVCTKLSFDVQFILPGMEA